jgi:hypothetical protein
MFHRSLKCSNELKRSTFAPHHFETFTFLFGKNVSCSSSKIYRRSEVGACALLCVYHSLRFARLLSSASLPPLTDSLLHSRHTTNHADNSPSPAATTFQFHLQIPLLPNTFPPLQFLFLVVFLRRCCCFAGSQVPYPPKSPSPFVLGMRVCVLGSRPSSSPTFSCSPPSPPAIIPNACADSI